MTDPDAIATPAHRAPEGAVVLVVEDEDTIRLATQRALSRRGYEVVVAADGLEALRILQERAGQVDVVLTDVTMPTMTGRELVRRIETEHPGLPIVLMSGYAADLAQLGGAAEAPLFVQKPFSLDTLAATVAAALARRR